MRALSIISLLLLIASSIVAMVYDVEAVNSFIAAGKTESSSGNSTAIDCSVVDCDYIEYVLFTSFLSISLTSCDRGSTVPNQPAGAFWAVLNWLLVIFQAIFCILSEIGWPARFFSIFFPILGPDFGLGALGVIQCLLGAAVLSHHVIEFTLVSAFFVFALGCVNILLGLIFRERVKTKRSLREWKDQNKDVLPSGGFVSPPGAHNTFTNSNYGNEKGAQAWRSDSLNSTKSSLGFGRQATKAAEMQG